MIPDFQIVVYQILSYPNKPTSMGSLFIQLSDDVQISKFTRMTGFVVQGHIYIYIYIYI